MSSLQEVWAFLLDPENRATLAFLGAGVAAVAAAIWKIYTHFSKKPAPE
jgi:hypothetical protein